MVRTSVGCLTLSTQLKTILASMVKDFVFVQSDNPVGSGDSPIIPKGEQYSM